MFAPEYRRAPEHSAAELTRVRDEAPLLTLRAWGGEGYKAQEFYRVRIGKTSPELLKTFLFRVNEVDKEAFQKSARRNQAIMMFSPFALAAHCHTVGFTRRTKTAHDEYEYASSFRAARRLQDRLQVQVHRVAAAGAPRVPHERAGDVALRVPARRRRRDGASGPRRRATSASSPRSTGRRACAGGST